MASSIVRNSVLRRTLVVVAILFSPISLFEWIFGEPGGILDTTSDAAAVLYFAASIVAPAFLCFLCLSSRIKNARWMGVGLLLLVVLLVAGQRLEPYLGVFGPRFPARFQNIANDDRGIDIDGTHVGLAYGPTCVMCAGGELWILQTRPVLPGLVLEQTIGPGAMKGYKGYRLVRSHTLVVSDLYGAYDVEVKRYVFFRTFTISVIGLRLYGCDQTDPWTPRFQALVTRLFCLQ